jgi:mycothiol system anti-sigma-R factor
MENKIAHHLHPDGRHCSELLAELSEYVDGSLQQSLCEAIEHHLQDCPNCTIVVDTLRKTIQLFQATSFSEHIPDDMRERLYKNLNLEDFLKPVDPAFPQT